MVEVGTRNPSCTGQGKLDPRDRQECGVSGMTWPQAKVTSDKTVPASLGPKEAGAVASA